MNTQTKQFNRTLRMTQLGILSAIIIVMAFTPLGYLKIGPVDITFLMIPVAIGAILLGPVCGGILGGIFGITSFIQCFGMSPFGVALFAINPFATFITCMIPRILIGILCAYIYRAIAKIDKTHIISFAVSSASAAIINTVLFVGCVLLFFRNSDYLAQFGNTVIEIISVLVTFNAALEIGVSLVVGTAISKVVLAVMKKHVH